MFLDKNAKLKCHEKNPETLTCEKKMLQKCNFNALLSRNLAN